MGIAMGLGRFAYAVPVLAIAGALAAKPRLQPTAGTLPTNGVQFVGLLLGVILILGGLQYFPPLALGPIVEHFQMLARPSPVKLRRQGLTMPSGHRRPRLPRNDALLSRAAARDAFIKLDPRQVDRQPGDPRDRGRRRPGHRVPRSRRSRPATRWPFALQIAIWLWATVLFANLAESVAEGRGKAAGRQPARHSCGHPRQVDRRPGQRTRSARSSASALQGRPSGPGRSRRHGPSRRRDRRGTRLGQRGGDHRRERARDPRVGRRPFGGHRRARRWCRTGSRSASPPAWAPASWTA